MKYNRLGYYLVGELEKREGKRRENLALKREKKYSETFTAINGKIFRGKFIKRILVLSFFFSGFISVLKF